jgi:hypothetical protein
LAGHRAQEPVDDDLASIEHERPHFPTARLLARGDENA